MNIPLVSCLMKHFYNGSSAELFYLKQEAGTSRLVTLENLSAQIQETSSLSKGDVVHTMSILMTEIRKVLVRGDRVKIPELGTFYMTLSCRGVEKEGDLSVRNVEQVNIRFLPAKALKLVNGALSPTRSDNNVSFFIKGAAAVSSGSGNSGNSGGSDDSGDSDNSGDENGDSYLDPNS
jgi:predicted histone-like DNA-binding protein